jgi:hypothetical protein
VAGDAPSRLMTPMPPVNGALQRHAGLDAGLGHSTTVAAGWVTKQVTRRGPIRCGAEGEMVIPGTYMVLFMPDEW